MLFKPLSESYFLFRQNHIQKLKGCLMVLLGKQKHKEESGNLLQLAPCLDKATPSLTAVSLQVNGGAWTSETPGTGLSSHIM